MPVTLEQHGFELRWATDEQLFFNKYTQYCNCIFSYDFKYYFPLLLIFKNTVYMHIIYEIYIN